MDSLNKLQNCIFRSKILHCKVLLVAVIKTKYLWYTLLYLCIFKWLITFAIADLKLKNFKCFNWTTIMSLYKALCKFLWIISVLESNSRVFFHIYSFFFSDLFSERNCIFCFRSKMRYLFSLLQVKAEESQPQEFWLHIIFWIVYYIEWK